MADNETFQDEAALYVLGQLGELERRNFEARLEKSAELRALVHQLETGSVALALSAPQRDVPARVWRQIEEEIADDVEHKVVTPPFWLAWVRSGWAAAAACLMGWLLYAFWSSHSKASVASPSFVSGERVEAQTELPDAAHGDIAHSSRWQGNVTNLLSTPASGLSLLAAKGEITRLRRQVMDLEYQLGQISEVVTQQMAVLSEPGQLRFLRLTPADSTSGPGALALRPSPELQRALLLAVARELGWFRPPIGRSSETEADSKQDENLGVEFVDLPAVGQDPSQHSSTQPGQSSTSSKPQPAPSSAPDNANGMVAAGSTTTPTDSGVAIPGFLSGTNAVFALDSAAVGGVSGQVLFLAGSSTTALSPQGSFTVGNDPIVVTMHGVPSGSGSLYFGLQNPNGTITTFQALAGTNLPSFIQPQPTP